jgi:hypothetical protein
MGSLELDLLASFLLEQMLLDGDAELVFNKVFDARLTTSATARLG